MALANAFEGAIHTAQTITWTDADGNPQDLTGATLSGTLKPDGGSLRAIAGDLDITDAEAGTFTWTYGAADVVTGYYRVQFKATYAGGTYDLTHVQIWRVYDDQGE